MRSELSIGIAGAGRMAQALGRLLVERGEPVAAVASRGESAARAAEFIGGGVEAVSYKELPRRAGRILIAVADSAVPAVAGTLAEAMAEAGLSGGVALHTCGSLGPEALEPLADRGVSCGTIHPLQTVAAPGQGVAALPGSAFAVAGDTEALAWAERIAAILDGEPLRIAPKFRPVYHAAAVMASNYVVTLLDAAVILMGAAGITEDRALRAIAPLAKASLNNAADLGPLRALTGPIERGDSETVALHLNALEKEPESVRELYRSAGLHALDLARRRGLNEAAAKRVETVLRKR
jgi:predicted short-subunit dehydrogenase-like oxidoreductase (DUF2520 family)